MSDDMLSQRVAKATAGNLRPLAGWLDSVFAAVVLGTAAPALNASPRIPASGEIDVGRATDAAASFPGSCWPCPTACCAFVFFLFFFSSSHFHLPIFL